MKKDFIKRRCPRCGGNIYPDRDYRGWYEQCLQCGYTRDLESIAENKTRVHSTT